MKEESIQTKSIQTKGHIAWIDTARCLAIISVVLCHTTQEIYSFNEEFMMGLSTQSRIFGFSAFSLGRLGVPLFLFITGYLLLDRRYDKQSWLAFWKNNLLSLLIVAEIWIVIYDIFLSWFDGMTFTFTDVLCNMLFLKNVEMSHVWYMPMILGIYLFLPLLANCIQIIDKNILKILLAVIFIYSFVVPIISIWNKIQTGESLSVGVELEFLGGYYGFYVIIGYLVKKGEFKNIKTWIFVIGAVIMFASIVGIQLFYYYNDYAYNVWYDCVFILICAFCIFIIISRLPQLYTIQPFIQDIAKKSFGIYLVHNPIRKILGRYTFIGTGDLIMPIKVLLLFVITFLLSWLLVTLICKIPKVGKFLMGVK